MGIEAGSTNRWKSARERDRLRSRYLIKSRVISRVTENGDDDDSNAQLSTLEEMNVILRYLHAIINNDLSAFSVVSLARHGHLLDSPLPAAISIPSANHCNNHIDCLSEDICKTGASSLEEATCALSMFLSTTLPWEIDTTILSKIQYPQPTTLATSKFGPEYVTKRLVPYMQHLNLHRHRQLTCVEYASLLGRHGIVASLLLGGIDPTVGGDISCDRGDNTRVEVARKRVLSLIHSVANYGEISIDSDGRGGSSCCTIPLSIWSYMIRSVIEMRMNGVLDTDQADEALIQRGLTVCSICEHESHPLQFGPPCHHTFCEPCLWNQLVDKVPLCTDLTRNVVTCPVCDEEFEGFKCIQASQRSKKSSRILEEKKEEKVSLSLTDLSMQADIVSSLEIRQQRRIESLDKFVNLPTSSNEIKSHKKKKKARHSAHCTWEDALRSRLQGLQTSEVRSDRFFKAVLSETPPFVIGYLDAGVDVNMQNTYGQTPLYVACWKGPAMVVKWLLEYGADFSIPANGGSTCFSVATKYHRKDVLHVLERYGVNTTITSSTTLTNQLLAPPINNNNYEISVLIDPTVHHPGAGALIVDNALSEIQLQQLDTLFQSLPVGDACDDEQSGGHSKDESDDRIAYRPSRSYFCDSEGELQSMLKGCVQAARIALTSLKKCNESIALATPTNNRPPLSIFSAPRFLNYEKPGGILPPHLDLCRVDAGSGLRSTHTFILYLTDCEDGGGTALLKSLKDPQVLAVSQPKRGRALIFPHVCPHSGLEVDSAPKLLLRGEVILDLPI